MAELTPELEEIADTLAKAAARSYCDAMDEAMFKKYPIFAAEVKAAPRGTFVIFRGE